MTTNLKTGIVEEIMSSPVVTVEMDDSLEVVQEIFEAVRFHHLLVVSEDGLVGVLSDRDYLKVISPKVGTVGERKRDRDTLKRRAHQVMTRKPFTLLAGDSIEDAIKLFNAHTISCIPVVNENNKPIGILSWRDIFQHIVPNAA